MIDIDDVKGHLRISHSDEDGLINLYLNAAIKHIADYLDMPIYETEEARGDKEGLVIDDEIKAAILLIVTDLYENRLVSDKALTIENSAAYNLVRLKRRMGT